MSTEPSHHRDDRGYARGVYIPGIVVLILLVVLVLAIL
jgi:hypothetical protein